MQPNKQSEKEFILEKLIELYTDISNLTKDLTPSMLKKYLSGLSEVDILENRQALLNKKLISLINLLAKKESRLQEKPYVRKLKVKEIMEELRKV